jgi:hypothetical protein
MSVLPSKETLALCVGSPLCLSFFSEGLRPAVFLVHPPLFNYFRFFFHPPTSTLLLEFVYSFTQAEAHSTPALFN